MCDRKAFKIDMELTGLRIDHIYIFCQVTIENTKSAYSNVDVER